MFMLISGAKSSKTIFGSRERDIPFEDKIPTLLQLYCLGRCESMIVLEAEITFKLSLVLERSCSGPSK